MRTTFCLLIAGVLSLMSLRVPAADVLTPGFLKVSLYTGIPGTAVSALTADPRYPAAPSEVRYLRSFNTRDALPNDALHLEKGVSSEHCNIRLTPFGSAEILTPCPANRAFNMKALFIIS